MHSKPDALFPPDLNHIHQDCLRSDCNVRERKAFKIHIKTLRLFNKDRQIQLSYPVVYIEQALPADNVTRKRNWQGTSQRQIRSAIQTAKLQDHSENE